MKRVLVTGATGFIGRRVCDTLQEEEYDVIAVSRNTERAREKLQSVDKIYAWNPEREQLPSDAISDTHAVIHLAGESIAGRWNAKKNRGYETAAFIPRKTLFPHSLHQILNLMYLYVLLLSVCMVQQETTVLQKTLPLELISRRSMPRMGSGRTKGK